MANTDGGKYVSSKIGLISDVHATPAPLQEALSLFQQHDVEIMLCAGDIAGYATDLEPTISLLAESACQSILGNHDLWYLQEHEMQPLQPATEYFSKLPTTRQLTIDNVTLYMVHASPPDSCIDGIRLLDQEGKLLADHLSAWTEHLTGFEYDVLIVGHTHQVFAERLGDTLVVNPGSSKFNNTCAILTLPECTVEWLPLGNKTPQRIWNWSGGWVG